MTFSEDENDDPSIIGEEAHIIGRKKDAARGTDMRLALGKRDVFSNLILLCRNHHKEIDDKENEYTVDRLLAIKAEHEKEVAESQSIQSKRQLDLELMYAGVVDKWVTLSMLDDWKDVGSGLCGDTASFPKEWLDSMENCCEWLFSRVWDDEFAKLRDAFTNFRLVARDLLNTFYKHVEGYDDNTQVLRTKRFYKIDEYNEKLYHKLLKEYNEHDNLINDLFFELTRAANYICDKVRTDLDFNFRRTEGALYVFRWNVGFEMSNLHIRPEYHDGERVNIPYPGLDEFKEIRYSRDQALDPNPPQPPSQCKFHNNPCLRTSRSG